MAPPQGLAPTWAGLRVTSYCQPPSPYPRSASPRRSKAEMRHTCRGTINLATANITVEDSCNFIISNGGAQTYHLKASSEVERQRWVTALELAKAKAVKMLEESGTALAPTCHRSLDVRPRRQAAHVSYTCMGPSPSAQGLFCCPTEHDPTSPLCSQRPFARCR